MPMYHMHAVSAEARREHRLPWNWSYGWLRASVWELGIEPGSSGLPLPFVPVHSGTNHINYTTVW